VVQHAKEGDSFEVEGARVTVMETRGVKPDHLSYLLDEEDGGVSAFPGDLILGSASVSFIVTADLER